MKLTSIKLCNFRQFYGKTPEILLASGEQNTTIIHGNNGSGKTTLLNAFTKTMLRNRSRYIMIVLEAFCKRYNGTLEASQHQSTRKNFFQIYIYICMYM